MRPGQSCWLGLLLCVPFSTLTLTVQLKKGHLAHQNNIPLIHRGSLPEKVDEENPMQNQLIHDDVEKRP